MQDQAFDAHMASENLAEKTRVQRIYALKRIERIYDINLDDQYQRDGLAALAAQFRYSAEDARAARPNPTKMDIDPDKLLMQLRWYRSHIQVYRRFKGADTESGDSAETTEEQIVEEAVIESVGRTFALERDMQAALRANLADLELGLVAIDGGVEKRVEAGLIDILARDAKGVPTVIELKAETPTASVIAQILAYMSCVAEETGGDVRGIIVASDYSTRVSLAARAVPNLTLKKYRYKFEFE